MEPTRDKHGTLVDLLDRVLDKGIVIHADLIISLAGVPLIGVSLKAALAGMETMLQYGMMQEWDESARAWENEHRKKKISVVSEEEIILSVLGSYYYSEGIYTAWRMGRIYLTGKRLILYHPSFEEVIFETPLENIKGAWRQTERFFSEKERSNLCLLLQSGDVVRLHSSDTAQLLEAIEQRMSILGLGWEGVLSPARNIGL